MNHEQLRDFLNVKADFYNNQNFIEHDPISIPHKFSLKQDIEISGFLTATISWGNRKSILKSAEKMLELLDFAPYDFIKNFTDQDLKYLEGRSIHRTFNGEDFSCFLQNLQRIYSKQDSLEDLFLLNSGQTDHYHSLERFRQSFLGQIAHRSHKHVSSTYKNSSAKRLMMYLRWMVRRDNRGVDFGLWKKLSPAHLSVPLDIHTGNISRRLGLIERTQNDWKAVKEMDAVLRKFNPEDPAIYDFALFGLGVSGDF